jgi:hypothetical protein
LDCPTKLLNRRPDWYFIDNGFPSEFAMKKAHEPIVDLAAALVAGSSGAILDLGCGNGALLENICNGNSQAIPFGVDSEALKIAHACELFPSYSANFFTGDMFENEAIWHENRRYILTLLMPGRLLEVAPAQAERLKRRLRDHSTSLVVYAYGDWLTRYGNLGGIVEKVGLRLLSAEPGVSASLARVP